MRRGIVRNVGIVVERHAATSVEPGDVAALRAGAHGVGEGLDLPRAFRGAVGIYSATFGRVVAVVVAEAAAGRAVVLSGRLKSGVWSGPGERDPVVGAGEVDVDFADVSAGEVGVAERCIVRAGFLDRQFLIGSKLRIG